MEDTAQIYAFIRKECQRLAVSETLYGLGDQPTQGLGELKLDHNDGYWRVFVTERGIESDFCLFERARDAITFFIMSLCVDHENRVIPKINFRDMPK